MINEIELKDEERYLAKTATKWHVGKYDHTDGFIWTDAGGYIVPENITQIIPLSLAIRAPELQAENERLRAACLAFVEAWEKSHQLEKTDVALRLAKAALEGGE